MEKVGAGSSMVCIGGVTSGVMQAPSSASSCQFPLSAVVQLTPVSLLIRSLSGELLPGQLLLFP